MNKLVMPSVNEVRRMLGTRCAKSRRFYANDFSALNPTIWAQEALVQFLPNMVMGALVNRDFEDKLAKFGDIVNAWIPGDFTMTRKGALCENVVVQDASGASTQVALDQWPQVSFLICDGEEDRSALDLVDTLLTPAVQALATGVDRILSSQVHQFYGASGGHLLGVDDTNVKQYMIETREAMNRNNVPLRGRSMILTPGTESQALEVDTFMEAHRVGDDGTALREASLGRKYGFDLFMTQTAPEVSAGQTTVGVVAVNNAGGYAAGTTVIAFDGAGAAAVAPGQWASIAGDDTPQHITAAAGPSPMTISPGLKRSVANDAVITIIAPGAVNNAAGYAGTTTNPRVIGHNKEILVDGFANSAPQIGQLVTFGTQTEKYAIIKLRIINLGAGTFGIELDRPLVDDIADDDTVNLGPAGKYNFAFVRNAFVMVSRPLPAPRAGTGALSYTVRDTINKVTIRVTITYDGERQGHLVTLDFLMGVGTLSEDSGAVMFG